MKFYIGLMMVYTAIIFGGVAMFGYDLPLKERILIGISLEIFLALIVFGVNLMMPN